MNNDTITDTIALCDVLEAGPLGYRYQPVDISTLESAGLLVEVDGTISRDPDCQNDWPFAIGVTFPLPGSEQGLRVQMADGTWL